MKEVTSTSTTLNESIRQCTSLGGKVVTGPKNFAGHGCYCAIRDPAGAVVTLFEPLKDWLSRGTMV